MNEHKEQSWLQQKNPFYLLSVLLLFGALTLASSAAKDQSSLPLALSFFVVQNIYEIVILAMGLYLLKKNISPGQGRLLLFFCLLLAGDITFFHVTLASMFWVKKIQGAGYLIPVVYLLLCAAKLYAVHKLLEIKIYGERIFYFLGSCGLIYAVPHYVYTIIENAQTVFMARAFGVWESYSVWLLASCIMLPVIVAGWKESSLEKTIENQYFGNLNTFYRLLLVFPFVMLPLQLMFNMHSDLQISNQFLFGFSHCYFPYLIFGMYFVQILWKKGIKGSMGELHYDFWVTAGLALALFLSMQKPELFGDMYFTPDRINFFMLFLAALLEAITRKNPGTALFVVTVVFYHAKDYSIMSLEFMANLIKDISKTAWAVLLALFSFVFLGAGFYLSVKSNNGEKSAE